jgi:hypothetical protein
MERRVALCSAMSGLGWQGSSSARTCIYGNFYSYHRQQTIDEYLRAIDILEAHITHLPDQYSQIMELLPSQEQLDIMLDALPSTALDARLGVVDELVPSAAAVSFIGAYDTTGLSSYARITSALVHLLARDRQLARQNTYRILRHVMALIVYGHDWLQMASGATNNSPAFRGTANADLVRELHAQAQQLIIYLLVGSYEAPWHASVVAAIGGKSAKLDAVGTFVVAEVQRAKRADSVRDARILGMGMEHVLKSVEQPEFEQWVGVARTLEKSGNSHVHHVTRPVLTTFLYSAPFASRVVIALIARFAPETPRLDRYRNELAANALGIRAPKASTEGLVTLQRLVAAAPPLESDAVFLPQPRAVNLLKACQQWIAGDDDDDDDDEDEDPEELESVMTLLFLYAAPILQHVPGAHWDFIFDVVDNNLEVGTLMDR